MTDRLQDDCERLRDLHVPGRPLMLPNAWDAATARAVEAAGLPVVATTSGGVALSLGHEDHEQAPADEMLAAAARIAAAVDVPVTVDAEAGYGLEPGELVARLHEIGAAGCNLEDTDHGAGELRPVDEQAQWLASVREAARSRDYDLVINARIDVFLPGVLAGGGAGEQEGLVGSALKRARAYAEAEVDCVYPIALWEEPALAAFVADCPVAVNTLAVDRAPKPERMAELSVARISWGSLLHRAFMGWFESTLDGLPRAP